MPSDSASKTYGTVSADEQKKMSGLEFVQGLADGTLPLDTIARTLGYDITEAESGRVVVTAEPKDIHLNPAGTVHGGLAATMLDSCMGLRSNRPWTTASAPRPLSSRYHSSGRSRRRQDRSRLRVR
jgi:acyl-coenzyme A thioesterase PaaI-like protein